MAQTGAGLALIGRLKASTSPSSRVSESAGDAQRARCGLPYW